MTTYSFIYKQRFRSKFRLFTYMIELFGMFLIVVHSSTIDAIVAVSSVFDLILHFIFDGNSISKYYLLPHQRHTLGADRLIWNSKVRSQG